MAEQGSSEPKIRYSGLSLVFLTPALGGFLNGYDIGCTSFVLSQLNKHHPHKNGKHETSTAVATPSCHNWWEGFASRHAQQGLTVAATSLGALMGCHLVLVTGHYFQISRRTELRVAATLYLLGLSCNILSGLFCEGIFASWYWLFVGRCIFGVGIGLVMHGAPTYLSEMAPSSIRGAIVGAKETVIVLGILVGYIVGDLLVHRPWIELYMVALALAIPMFILTLIIPRSKRWLLMHGYHEEAEQSMRYIFKGDIQYEFEKLANSIHTSRMRHTPSTSADWDSMTNVFWYSESVRPALTAALGLIVFQQLSGQPSILSYATLLFSAAGWGGHATVAAALVMLAMSSTTVMLVDRMGRKRLLRYCMTVLMVAASALSAVFWDLKNGAGRELTRWDRYIILIAMFAYIGGYQIGFGPLTWVVVSEIFPGDARGPATALGVELNFLLKFLVQFFVPIVQNSIGWGPTFALFGCIMIVAMVFLYRYVPETAGLSLEEIDAQLHQKKTKKLGPIHSETSPLVQRESA